MKLLIYPLKVIGLFYVFLAIPFRAYARNYVYNYVLQNDKREWLGRLWERKPDFDAPLLLWVLHDGPHKNMEGIVKYRKVNKITFYLIVWFVYGWLDDDSCWDTTDKNHIQGVIDHPHTWDVCGKLARKWLKPVETSYGNSFDLGDVREPYYQFWATFVWNCRNPAMNFQYLWMGY